MCAWKFARVNFRPETNRTLFFRVVFEVGRVVTKNHLTSTFNLVILNFQYFEKSYKDKVALEPSEKFEKLQSLPKTNQSKHIIPISMGSLR